MELSYAVLCTERIFNVHIGVFKLQPDFIKKTHASFLVFLYYDIRTIVSSLVTVCKQEMIANFVYTERNTLYFSLFDAVLILIFEQLVFVSFYLCTFTSIFASVVSLIYIFLLLVLLSNFQETGESLIDFVYKASNCCFLL
jgi:hypothetical protein